MDGAGRYIYGNGDVYVGSFKAGKWTLRHVMSMGLQWAWLANSAMSLENKAGPAAVQPAAVSCTG
jgi:hypothetical protein